MPNWRGLVSIYDEWIAVLFIFTAAERLRSTSHSSRTNNSWLFAPSSLILVNHYLPLNGALGHEYSNAKLKESNKDKK
jgi:hypothetical protein